MANIVVACGSGVATSETVVSLIKGFFEDHNISGVNVEATDFKGLAGVLPNYDIYVWIAKPTKEIQDICDREGIVDVNGVNILTGNNSDNSYKKILWALQKMTM
ncbi:PTS galactitol transporter subunit IIB [Ligilactobacillus salivarius]|uniref:PTS galactitol transporter subunit IIB n=1 Tax=Ligilactobacillus salivarius TaxID=1624 RepID=UPI000667DFBD|nr:PTS galactitol transporter subunit IIB [Ligilactobacillus salivarius]MDE1499240.1 PTS galactitol transporter subunit IIB [Ligilactobacillus salivarius]MDE1523595.1 PTS galactitol transporter subunit IIB [Ligilactobacillus salivarius]MDE1526032.1 PTS galactitol transporter subunit IIB [Ligilactobacillus salivarius]MDL1930731.1 PTS galactitol transporter subunit IIB [Ligilactobacillus salivarius]OQQ78355.1 PTS galactitol transporter subunit IIB [Ligilactobacillus salivarius]